MVDWEELSEFLSEKLLFIFENTYFFFSWQFVRFLGRFLVSFFKQSTILILELVIGFVLVFNFELECSFLILNNSILVFDFLNLFNYLQPFLLIFFYFGPIIIFFFFHHVFTVIVQVLNFVPDFLERYIFLIFTGADYFVQVSFITFVLNPLTLNFVLERT